MYLIPLIRIDLFKHIWRFEVGCCVIRYQFSFWEKWNVSFHCCSFVILEELSKNAVSCGEMLEYHYIRKHIPWPLHPAQPEIYQCFYNPSTSAPCIYINHCFTFLWIVASKSTLFYFEIPDDLYLFLEVFRFAKGATFIMVQWKCENFSFVGFVTFWKWKLPLTDMLCLFCTNFLVSTHTLSFNLLTCFLICIPFGLG